MRTFLPLLRREARDTRALIVVLAVIAPLALIAYEEFFGHYTYGASTARWFGTAAAALCGLLIASDLVASDVSTGRMDALASLPTGLGRIWAAKVTHLVVATLAFGVYALTVTTALYALRASGAANTAMQGASGEAIARTPIALVPAFAALFFSTLLPRGFAATVAGVATVGAPAFAMWSIDFWALGIDAGDTILVAVPATISALLLAGSLVAFTRGPIHSRSLVRKWALALLIPICIGVPTGAAAIATVEAHTSFVPGDEDVNIYRIDPSPDGRYLALHVKRFGARRAHVWIVNVESGAVHVVDGTYVIPAEPAWTAAGTFRVWECDLFRWPGSNANDVKRAVMRWVEPTDGLSVKSRSWDQLSAESQVMEKHRAGWRGQNDAWWGSSWSGREKDGSSHTSVQWAGRSMEVPAGTKLSVRPHHAFQQTDDDSLRLRDLQSGDDVLSIPVTGTATGRLDELAGLVHVYEFAKGSASYSTVNSETGAIVGTRATARLARDEQAFAMPNGFGPWVRTDSGLLQIETGARVELPDARNVWRNVVNVAGGRVAVAQNGRVKLLDRTGKVIRAYIR